MNSWSTLAKTFELGAIEHWHEHGMYLDLGNKLSYFWTIYSNTTSGIKLLIGGKLHK
jgi:hypothetical protein